ncbi:DUF2063 domain-containing protein [Roseomonas sp. M0104]|uniref:DUF2063 domain-containing protein n=1 Tax=Teichococcus coralli TaxID=2545983 RepID=A0A845B724_9PROT|nr:DNA-binding domain-containing protein [Pseudoroseomonas coralli]MXP61884.1 DUF2063 domain-containing protein [Pseudoroseomonas coralli]
MNAAAFQAGFARALLDPEAAPPTGLRAAPGADLARRFAVYRNNVAHGLIAALALRHPAVQRLVGKDFFAGMARAFVQHHPPRSPVLLEYGDGFPEFVAGFPPAAGLPYLADVARLEAARVGAYHAADVPPLRLEAVADAAQDAPLRLALHPAARLLRSPHPVVTLWAMNAGEMPLGPVASWEGEEALVTRPDLQVLVHRLPPGGAGFAMALGTGAGLADAAAHCPPGFSQMGTLAILLRTGALVEGGAA